MSGGSAPAQDPRMAEAAMMNAQTGQEYLAYMRGLGDISTAWAQEDRERYQTIFQPLEDKIVAEAQTWDTPGRRAARADQAEADVIAGAGGAREAAHRRDTAMGIAPNSGRSIALGKTDTLREGLARAGARNNAARQVEAEGDTREIQAASLGRGLQVNPAASLGLGGNLTGAGFEGQMAGFQSQASILGQDHAARMRTYNADQAAGSSLWGGVGNIAGMLLAPTILSSKRYKTERTEPSESPLEQVERMPVQEYRYKEGVADSGAEKHIGPMAEDFREATGKGDGRTISIPDAVGVTMGAVQEVGRRVKRLEGAIGRMIKDPEAAGVPA